VRACAISAGQRPRVARPHAGAAGRARRRPARTIREPEPDEKEKSVRSPGTYVTRFRATGVISFRRAMCDRTANYDGAQHETCVICSGNKRSYLSLLPCGHQHHPRCMMSLLRAQGPADQFSCPRCTSPASLAGVTPSDTPLEKGATTQTPSHLRRPCTSPPPGRRSSPPPPRPSRLAYPAPPATYSAEARAACAAIAADLSVYAHADVVRAAYDGEGDAHLRQIMRWASYSAAEDWMQDYAQYRERRAL